MIGNARARSHPELAGRPATMQYVECGAGRHYAVVCKVSRTNATRSCTDAFGRRQIV